MKKEKKVYPKPQVKFYKIKSTKIIACSGDGDAGGEVDNWRRG